MYSSDLILVFLLVFFFFFFNDTATTEIYTLSLHDALPIFGSLSSSSVRPLRSMKRFSSIMHPDRWSFADRSASSRRPDRKSTRLNSSHSQISYAVFCLKKKKKKK